MDYQDRNAGIITKWIEDGWRWGLPISHEEYLRATTGDWSLVLTPHIKVPHEWFGDIKGKKILGLAAGGGQQMPILSAVGGICTVLDYCEKQLQSEIEVANREGYSIKTVRADMTKPLPFEDGVFDIIVHPASNTFVKDVKPIFKECYRVLKRGGIFLGGFDNGISFAFDRQVEHLENILPVDPISNPEHMQQICANGDAIEFSHTVEEQLGGQLEAGFRLTHIKEDMDTDGGLAEHNVSSFLLTRAVKE